MKVDGKTIANTILADLKQQVDDLKSKHITPQLAVILVGDNAASEVYVRQKELKGTAIGANITVQRLPDKTTTETLLTQIHRLNSDPSIHGIIIQRPLPPHIDTEKIQQAVNPKKDIDGFHPNSPFPVPVAAAVLKMLESIYSSSVVSPKADKSRSQNESSRFVDTLSNNNQQAMFIQWLQSKHIVVLGKGETAGGPIITLLQTMHVQPTVIDSKTTNSEELLQQADIIISAVGKPEVISVKDIKNGVILIGIGISRGVDGKLVGDYNEQEIAERADFYIPTPGGVGPVNVAMLLKNLVDAATTSLLSQKG